MTDPQFHLVQVTTVFVTRVYDMAFHKLMLPHQTVQTWMNDVPVQNSTFVSGDDQTPSVSSVYRIITKIQVQIDEGRTRRNKRRRKTDVQG